MTNFPSLTLIALPGIPIVKDGDDLARLIFDALERAAVSLQAGDVLVVTSKIVSKAEGRTIRLSDVQPSADALKWAAQTGKDPRVVELVLRESTSVSRAAPNVLVVQHRLGFVSANGGIDQSNVDGTDERVLLLPLDPDASAAALRARLGAVTGIEVGVILCDSHGRPFRFGNVGVAIGVAGMPALIDLRGQTDLFGRVLKISIQGYADMVASAACLLTGEGGEGLPVVLVRGLNFPAQAGQAADIYRPPEQDLYR
ncbi:MAG: coenzyme F420-0:L-glutamate ligase [Chloroflexota bacterium]|nr:coenzyme F420-0:L-glutamate ligase [Chloroflexota bacterium]